MRVVVIDDNESLRMLIRLNLELELAAAVVGEAGDGAAGVDVIASTRPDVAVVDLHMPGMSGMDLIRAVRARGLPVHLVAYSADSSLLDEARAAGADMAVCKTTDVQQLALLVKESLDSAA